jgi:uncharacterized membrane protein YgcG
MKKSETQQIMNEPYQVFLPELHKEILNSKTIKVYNSFQKLNYTTYIKWFMFFGFTIGAISLMINDTPPLWVKIVMGCGGFGGFGGGSFGGGGAGGDW